MITLVLDNVTYYYNILISAISIYLDKSNCKSPPSLDFRHTKLCIKHITLMMDNNDVKHLVMGVSQLEFSLTNIICLINGAYIFYLNPIIMLNILYRRAKLGQIQGGVAEGHPRFDKGGVAIIFYFYALKIELFRVFTLSD